MSDRRGARPRRRLVAIACGVLALGSVLAGFALRSSWPSREDRCREWAAESGVSDVRVVRDGKSWDCLALDAAGGFVRATAEGPLLEDLAVWTLSAAVPLALVLAAIVQLLGPTGVPASDAVPPRGADRGRRTTSSRAGGRRST